MSEQKKIATALISVYNKDGLEDLLKTLDSQGVKFISTGGTRLFIEKLGYECEAVEDITGYPSIFGGRVKTLHPKVFGGILHRRDVKKDRDEAKAYAIAPIDLVIVDLYPFSETVASGATHDEIIEKIDIGGISLIRAAAKNYKDVVIIPSQAQYPWLSAILASQGANTTLEQRQEMATAAFGVSSMYDSQISNYFQSLSGPSDLRIAIDGCRTMRYGENPHQKGWFYGNLDRMFTQLHGKEISYNNLLDIDAATSLIAEFNHAAGVTFAVLKHNNACGVATRNTVEEAWEKALAGDPVSAFGGVLITNAEITEAAAEEINKIFFEVIIAPSYTEDALNILKQKKNRIILVQKEPNTGTRTFRSLLGGALVQERDNNVETAADMRTVTATAPTAQQITDMAFANIIVKHSKSNAIVLANNGMLLASGVGQTSRVDALKQAIAKAQSFELPLEGAVMASDAFFPFADCVTLAAQAGIKAVIQPGGSVRDQDSIDRCNALDLAMVMTGVRHFRH